MLLKDATDTLVLDYGSRGKIPSDLAAWIVTLSLGVTGGYLLSVVAYGPENVALVVGAIIGTTIAAVARRHRITFGLIGNWIAVVVSVALGCIDNARAGIPNEDVILIMMVPLNYAFCSVPGAMCGAMLVVAREMKRGRTGSVATLSEFGACSVARSVDGGYIMRDADLEVASGGDAVGA